MRHLLLAFCLACLALEGRGADEPTAGLIPRAVIVVPLGAANEEPIVVFMVKNTGKTDAAVRPFLSPGSELEWKGPRGVTWRDVIGSSVAADVPVPAGSDVKIGEMPVHDLRVQIGMGAKVHQKTLIDGDEFQVAWMVNGVPSNVLLFRYSRAQ